MNAATFGLPVLVTALAVVAAVLSSRLSERLRIPAPAFFLFAVAVPLRTIEPGPWSLGIRFQHEPEGLHRFMVAPGAAADTTPVGGLPVTADTWVSFIIRDGRLVSIRPDTMLRAGDEAVVLSGDPEAAGLPALFAGPHGPSP